MYSLGLTFIPYRKMDVLAFVHSILSYYFKLSLGVREIVICAAICTDVIVTLYVASIYKCNYLAFTGNHNCVFKQKEQTRSLKKFFFFFLKYYDPAWRRKYVIRGIG